MFCYPQTCQVAVSTMAANIMSSSRVGSFMAPILVILFPPRTSGEEGISTIVSAWPQAGQAGAQVLLKKTRPQYLQRSFRSGEPISCHPWAPEAVY